CPPGQYRRGRWCCPDAQRLTVAAPPAAAYAGDMHNDVRRTDAIPTATMVSLGTSDEKSRPMSNLTNSNHSSVDRADNGVALAASSTGDRDIANILIVEHDADCADALETILSDLPGITTVQTAVTAGAAFDLLDDRSYDVAGFGIVPNAVQMSNPDVIFIGAHHPDADQVEPQLLAAVTAFRSRIPDTSIVLLCVYPNQYRDTLRELVDGCIRKDTSARELRALIDNLRTTRASGWERATA
ncbi:MAG: hypothetical protein M3439_01915, partial [Chloroflexota bacterium]|nr:hypothetical protein [Chloroflexota bacterium]